MKNILIVDDEADIRNLIRKYAEFEGYFVDEASNGLEAIDKVRSFTYDLIILDVMMDGLNGFETCRAIRKEFDTPIIMLTAKTQNQDKYQGFDLGVDDYVTKPFSPKELMYRIQAVLKRSLNESTLTQYKWQQLCINKQAHTVTINDEPVELTPKEYELLLLFVENRGIVLQREQILNHVWGYDFDGDDRTLDTHIKRLRRKLKQYSSWIVTVRSVGYRFEPKEH
ncbi:response regulator transcription factor [Erysipelothrix inopinata]|uniref:Response regulator transcription factor n=1 Tax=Erysipelothrix inopinata TaxID=225084 RepID=A0A7G9RWM1_9FIRM|nr:response regulator transcription factor [Erysipelothrix inopinata]QNN59996.1 response regulator transcription factor [Erysipelothrix inopinata]